MRSDIISNLKKRVGFNLTKGEHKAMEDLLADDCIVIRSADKGSGIVILNTEDYVNDVENELMTCKSYKQCK